MNLIYIKYIRLKESFFFELSSHFFEITINKTECCIFRSALFNSRIFYILVRIKYCESCKARLFASHFMAVLIAVFMAVFMAVSLLINWQQATPQSSNLIGRRYSASKPQSSLSDLRIWACHAVS